MSSVDEVLAGYGSLQAGQEAATRNCTGIPNCPTRSTAPPSGSPGS